MGFKTDWSFLDKISMGAVGTEVVIDKLNQIGHQVIELERYCTSNKIWATKIKRFRIPDLLCLRCGRRIESRAKSKLGIIMSDSENNEERRWFCGLRDTDWVAFIQCFRDAENNWIASDTVNLFGVGEMKATEDVARLGPPKSVFEGAERDRKWACYIPGGRGTGTIVSIAESANGCKTLKMRGDDGRNHTHTIPAGHHIYVNEGDTFTRGAAILSGVVPHLCDCRCAQEQYNFLTDLYSDVNETVYAAVKALGYLPISEQATNELQRIANDDDVDDRIRLEAFTSLLKLGIDVWKQMYPLESIELKTEYVLILGEISDPGTAEYLFRVLQDTTNPGELRAAAIWSLPHTYDILSRVFPYCFDQERVVANHAMAKMRRYFSEELTEQLLSAFCGDDHRNAICAFLLSTAVRVDHKAVVSRYLSSDGKIRNWILYTMGISPEENYSELISRMDPDASGSKAKLMLLWHCQPMYLSGSEIEDVAFLEKQR